MAVSTQFLVYLVYRVSPTPSLFSDHGENAATSNCGPNKLCYSGFIDNGSMIDWIVGLHPLCTRVSKTARSQPQTLPETELLLDDYA